MRVHESSIEQSAANLYGIAFETGNKPVGSLGDASASSLHKTLPLPHGGTHDQEFDFGVAFTSSASLLSTRHGLELLRDQNLSSRSADWIADQVCDLHEDL